MTVLSIEQAFYQENIPPKVFDVHKDAELPNPGLVNRQISLLKLHGSAYGLRFGERLKHTLETDARNNSLGYIPKDALVLVMGFNGSERRIMQMLQAFVTAGENRSNKPRLIWIQGPSEPGPLFKELVAEAAGKVISHKVSHLDTFLQELYFHITCNSYQASTTNYSTMPSKLMITGLKNLPEITKEIKRHPVHLCIADLSQSASSSSWASLAGMAFVNSLDNGYTVIWIDIESHHTIEGIIADFFKRVRVVDPLAPSCSIISRVHAVSPLAPLDSITKGYRITKHEISKAIQRIFDVFKRGRYVLVLDSVESFGRLQMVHHGITKSYEESLDINQKKELENHHRNLRRFICELLHIINAKSINEGETIDFSKKYWDSYVIVTFDKPLLRHNLGSTDEKTKLKCFKSTTLLANLLKNKQGRTQDHIHILEQGNKQYSDLIINKNLIPISNLEKSSAHWRYGKNYQSDKNPLNRAKDVLSFLSAIRTEQSSEDIIFEKLREKPCVESYICLLSIFRRPRSLPLLRATVGLRKIGNTLLDEEISAKAHGAINKLHQLISTTDNPVGVVSQNHEGGSIWLYREIFESSYDALTENAHKSAFDSDQKPFSISAILDGILSITWHLYAARAYYVDVFLPTHDIHAFWEYLYHRVSAIRTIAVLIDIINSEIETIWDNLSKYCIELSPFCNIFKINHSETSSHDEIFGLYIRIIGVFEFIKREKKDMPENGKTNAQNLVDNLKLLRRNAMDTLLMALNKNKLLFSARPKSLFSKKCPPIF